MMVQINWIFVLILSLTCAIGSFIFLRLAAQAERAELRVRSLRRLGNPRMVIDEGSGPIGNRFIGAVGRFVLASGMLSRSTITALEQTIAASNTSTNHRLALFVGIKFVLFLGLPLLALVVIPVAGLHIPIPLSMVVLAVIGLLLPDMIVRRNRKNYLAAVDAGMPAALDLLIMCAEAGLSLEGGLERVSVDALPRGPRHGQRIPHHRQ